MSELFSVCIADGPDVQIFIVATDPEVRSRYERCISMMLKGGCIDDVPDSVQ